MKLIKKIVSVITMGTVLFNSFSIYAVEMGRVNCDLLNVRVSPNTECEIIDRMPTGTTFEIIYTDNGWYNIKMGNDVTGFVNADYVTNMTNTTYNGGSDAASIVANAHNYIGYPYSYGSSGPKSFDCSGFTSYLFKQQGYSLPRTSRDQGAFGQPVEKAELVAGDLVFFSSRSDRVINHVGLYIGNDEFIHASTSLRGVVKDSLNSNYYTKHYVTARRVL